MTQGGTNWAVRALGGEGDEVARTEIGLEAKAPSEAIELFRAFVLGSGGDLRRSAGAALDEQLRAMDAILALMHERIPGTEAKALALQLYRAKSLAKRLEALAR